MHLLLARYVEEEQEGDLLGVAHGRQAVVAQDMGVVPGFGDDWSGGST
jgi:hypothetical protein